MVQILKLSWCAGQEKMTSYATARKFGKKDKVFPVLN